MRLCSSMLGGQARLLSAPIFGLVGLALCGPAAYAQNAANQVPNQPVQSNSPVGQTQQNGFDKPHADTSTPVNLYPATVSPAAEIGKWLYDRGVYLTAGYTGQFAANPIGGERQGNAYAGKVDIGGTLDMEKIAGIDGGSFHFLMTDDHGKSLSNTFINSDLSVQNTYVGSQTYQIAIFTYEQKLFNNRVDINFGRTDLAFVGSSLYCAFQSHADCGRPSMLFRAIVAPIYPTAVWGGRVVGQITNTIYAKLGIYQPAPNILPRISHGTDWAIHTDGPDGGYELPIEVGYKAFTPGADAANQYNVGIIFNHSPFSAPYDNPKTPTQQSRSVVYAQAQQMVYQAEPNSRRGLYLFALGLFGSSGSKQVANFQPSFGAVWQGPFDIRPEDRIGVMFNDYHLNENYLDSLYKMRLKAHGTEFPYSNQATVELNYNIQVADWLQFMPNIQYVIHPDGLGFTPYPRENVPSALVFGVQMTVDLTTLVGIKGVSWASVVDN